jgi:alkylation response protein AidB-like acyl-CoA dehydrogenase
MTEYRAPTTDMRFTIEQVVGIESLLELDRFAHVDSDLLTGVLDEAGRFTSEVIAPLARVGDTVGSTLDPETGTVTTPPGYQEAYQAFVESGWPAAGFPEDIGGGGLPWAVAISLQEMVKSADLGFSLCPMLTYGAVDMLIQHGSDEQKATYLEKLVTGEWSGTMVLTESQAGSDVGALSTKAVPQDDGTYRITGTKIFITWGEHDLTENTIHIVLARTPDSPPGTKGISCFIVPKYLVGPDGGIGERNDLKCISIEEKVGIHSSPTCVLSFGDAGEGAVGYLIGEEHHGMRYMFTMMNEARLSVGIEGLSVSERAYQQASAYAQERIQGRAISSEQHTPVAIINHPDVRRMLMMMRAKIEAMRGVLYRGALAMDLARFHGDEKVREEEEALASILTPMGKAWASDLGVEVTSLGIQIHGGAGYVEETGAAQWWRDSRIAPIYEGTNGIQAMDLAMRRLPMEGGAAMQRLLTMVTADAASLEGDLKPIGERLTAAAEATGGVAMTLGAWLLQGEYDNVLAGATPFLKMMGDTLGGWALARGARAAAEQPAGFSEEFLADRIATAMFYAENVLPTVPGLVATATAGSAGLYEIPNERLVG